MGKQEETAADFTTATLIAQDFSEYIKHTASECKKNGGKIRFNEFARKCFEYGRRYEVCSILEQAAAGE